MEADFTEISLTQTDLYLYLDTLVKSYVTLGEVTPEKVPHLTFRIDEFAKTVLHLDPILHHSRKTSKKAFFYLRAINHDLKRTILELKQYIETSNLDEGGLNKYHQSMERLEGLLLGALQALQIFKNIHSKKKSLFSSILDNENDLLEILSILHPQKTQKRDFFIRQVEPYSLETYQNNASYAKSFEQMIPGIQIFRTLTEKAKECPPEQKNGIDHRHIPDLPHAIGQIRNGGEQFTSSCSIAFLVAIKLLLENQLNFTQSCLHKGSSVSEMTFLDFQKNVKDALEEYREGIPFCIQLTTGKQSAIELNHTVVILIHDNYIEYYDPKGIASSKRKFQDKLSLRQAIEYINDTHFNGSYTIKENRTIHQNDCHNCGAFVSIFLFQRLIRKKARSFLDSKVIPLQYVRNFRTGLANYLHDNIYQIAEVYHGYKFEVPENDFVIIDNPEKEKQNDKDDF